MGREELIQLFGTATLLQHIQAPSAEQQPRLNVNSPVVSIHTHSPTGSSKLKEISMPIS